MLRNTAAGEGRDVVGSVPEWLQSKIAGENEKLEEQKYVLHL